MIVLYNCLSCLFFGIILTVATFLEFKNMRQIYELKNYDLLVLGIQNPSCAVFRVRYGGYFSLPACLFYSSLHFTSLLRFPLSK